MFLGMGCGGRSNALRSRTLCANILPQCLHSRQTTVSESKSHIEIQIGGEKSFGIVFAVVFSLIGLYPYFSGGTVRTWALLVALVLLLLALFAPRALAIPNKLWFRLGLWIGAVVAPVVMALVYFLTVVPVGLIFRLLGKDLLRQKLDQQVDTYWIPREHPVGTMKDQF